MTTPEDVIANLLFANRIVRNGRGEWKGMELDREKDQNLAVLIVKALRSFGPADSIEGTD